MDFKQIIKERNKFFDKIFIITTFIFILINFIVLFINSDFCNIKLLNETKYYFKIVSIPILSTVLLVFSILFVAYISRRININYKLNKLKKDGEINNINCELNKSVKSDPINHIIYTETYLIIYEYNLHIIKYDNIKNAYIINKSMYYRYGGIRNSTVTKIVLNNKKQFEFQTLDMFEELKTRCKNSMEFKAPKSEKFFWRLGQWFAFIIWIIIFYFLIFYKNSK